MLQIKLPRRSARLETFSVSTVVSILTNQYKTYNNRKGRNPVRSSHMNYEFEPDEPLNKL